MGGREGAVEIYGVTPVVETTRHFASSTGNYNLQQQIRWSDCSDRRGIGFSNGSRKGRVVGLPCTLAV